MARPNISILSSVRQHLQRAVNIVMNQRAEGGWSISLPGLKYDDFNRAGLPSIVKMDRLAEVVRVQQVSGNDLSQLTLFFIGRRWTFTPQFYEKMAIEFPMKMLCTISGVGKSTYDVLVTYSEDCSNEKSTGSEHAVTSCCEPLATCVFRVINVDVEAYRPTPLPAPMVETLKENLVEGGERYPTFMPPTSVPETGTFGCRIEVRYDDMDVMFHTNHASYLAYSLECAARAANTGFYSKIAGDVAFYRARSTTSIHMGESRAGDQLEVNTWEDEENKLLLNFTVVNNGSIIYYAQVEFYDKSDIVSKL